MFYVNCVHNENILYIHVGTLVHTNTCFSTLAIWTGPDNRPFLFLIVLAKTLVVEL